MVGQELLGVGILDKNREFGEFFERTIGFLEGLEAVATHLDSVANKLYVSGREFYGVLDASDGTIIATKSN